MSGVLPTHERGPMSYQAAANLAGGMLVIKSGSNASTITYAGANALNVLGVCGDDAYPQPGTPPSYGTGALGNPLAVSQPLPWVRVYRNCEMRVTYAGNADFGDLLVAAASGQVAAMGTALDPRQIVGRCTEPGGVTGGAGTVARAWVAAF
jgi:hypothetical protein